MATNVKSQRTVSWNNVEPIYVKASDKYNSFVAPAWIASIAIALNTLLYFIVVMIQYASK
jgi:hypothetical protein